MLSRRAQSIWADAVEGASYATVGRNYGISKQAVHQHVKRVERERQRRNLQRYWDDEIEFRHIAPAKIAGRIERAGLGRLSVRDVAKLSHAELMSRKAIGDAAAKLIRLTLDEYHKACD